MGLREEVEKFLFDEARLLDQGRFDEWLALFADDGFYWIPAAPGQTDPQTHISIIYEDKSVLRMRIARLKHPRAYAAMPWPRTVHMIGNLSVSSGDEVEVCSSLIVVEAREGDSRTRAGLCLHRLRRTPASFKIVLKRLDLVDAERLPGVILVPL